MSTGWRSIDDPPACEPGDIIPVVVAFWVAYSGKWGMFGAWYANRYEVEDLNGSEGDTFELTGFCSESEDVDGNPVFRGINNIHAWHPMPDPPAEMPAKK